MPSQFLDGKDLIGSLFYAFDFRMLLLQSRMSKVVTQIIAYSRGLTVGAGCEFYGVPILRRFPGSKIDIGSRCRFRSSPKSNLVGLDRRCIIATHGGEARIVIGDGCGFSGTVIGSSCQVTIGSNVLCGGNTFITDFDWHPISDRQLSTARPAHAPVIIGDNVWLGYNTVVLKGVTIGTGTVVGANSVVTKTLPARVIAAGNPCRVIRKLFDGK